MDVSFTNVLEGARQYFQGLPTATCSTSNSSYAPGGEQGTHYTEQNQERAPTSSYWPPHQERSQQRELPQQRPPSHHSDTQTPRPSSHNQNVQEQIRTSSSYHAQNSHQDQSVPTSHSYQFTRPHPREVQQQQPQQQYQSHIMPNPAYQHQPQQQQQQQPASMQNRRPEMTTSTQYHHQMQQPQQHQQQGYSNYQQQNQNRSYYPVHTQSQQQPQYYHHSYQVASSQAYVQPQQQEVPYVHQSYPPHSQNSFANDSNYPTSKTHVSQDNNTLKDTNLVTSQNQQTSQTYRTTHNLPPIAALSSLNYHSSRSSREAIRLANNNKPRASGTSTSTSSTYINKPINNNTSAPTKLPSQQYSLQNNHAEYASTNAVQQQQQQQQVQNRPTGASGYQYQPPASSYANYTPVSSNLTTSNCQTQSSYAHLEPVKTYQTTKPIQQPQTNTTAAIKQKRESPLDLSVKTVRTSADSTLDDADTNANDQKRLAKYYQTGRPPANSPMQAPPTSYSHDLYNNSYQRNLPSKSTTLSSSGVPKVDFLPNFNVSALSQAPTSKVDARRLPVPTSCDNVNQRQYYERKNNYQSVIPQHSSNVIRHSVVHPPTSAHLSSNAMVQQSAKKPMPGLPRIDFLPPSHKTSTMYAVPSGEAQRKRTSDQMPPVVPNKIQKVDIWRQTIDQQIEQRLSSYAKSRLQQDQVQKPLPNKQLVNGNCTPTLGQDRKDTYSTYHRPQYNTVQTPHSYSNSTNHYTSMQSTHNQTYVPTPVAHQYPGYVNHGSQQQQSMYPQHSLPRTNSNPSIPMPNTNRSNLGGAADRRVLSLLRNSLEIKGAKEAQKKLEREQNKPLDHPMHHPRPDVQQPSTDVMAPLQPKPGLVGRHNMSPFAATSLYEQNSNTPPTYKFHLPKAIDSIKFDADISKDNRANNKNVHASMSNSDLLGLTDILAARIRTKAELKQVGTAHNIYNAISTDSLIRSSSETQLFKQSDASNGGSPPKLTRERVSYLPRRKLFNRTEDELNGTVLNNVPLRDKSGLRSSSETSVFDFPDSDSDTEMPVLERQSLLEMRRDRKVLPKPSVGNGAQQSTPVSPLDVSFDDACDKFMAQLKAGVGKKRGRRKKMVEADVLAKLETVVTREKPSDDIKIEPKTEDKYNSDYDSDTPLIKCKSQSQVTLSDTDECAARIKKEEDVEDKLGSDSGTESETETIKGLSTTLKTKESPKKDKAEIKQEKGKSVFGDGTDFYPGWEEEVYNYKRSLRMPAALIHVTRPPQWHRLSTSLPDLDPCPNSPCPSENQDSKIKIKSEPIDSDLDSNSNFSFSLAKNNYDSEEGSSSIKSVSNSTSTKPKNNILDRLLERCGARKRKRLKKKNEDNVPKIIPKSENELELLPTPSLEVEAVLTKKMGPIIKEESALLGFRKKTIDNFKDTFINSSKSLLGVNEEFKPVVLKSRTRMETRVLKQKATIKEVFGEDRPASAPPVTCVDNIEEIETKSEINVSFTNENRTTPDAIDLKASVLENTKEALKNKLLNRGRKGCVNLLKSLATKKIISEYDDDLIKRERDSKSETPSIDGDDYTPTRRRIKNMRRKFSSGFDYIRKKKKQVKKECLESDSATKPKRRGPVPKATPESEQDIQKEIKMWVMNKGIGETHLHRAARLGYTDITAYCLEKMDVFPSPKDNAGYTPLHEACARGHLSIAKLLLLYGANVSESAQGGIRPLHEAAENGFVEIVRLLLSYGADPTLATYSGLTPISLATEEVTLNLLQSHIADSDGQPSAPWNFFGPASFFDLDETGYDPLEDVPNPDPLSEDEDVEFEISDFPLPNLYIIRGEAPMDRWILLQDLSNILKIKSKDALLKQICPVVPSTSTNSNYKSVLRELKMADFLEQARCCQYMCVGEKRILKFDIFRALLCV
ncbi:hypothetical protein RN001_006875 [Aquatica leii]|uniref:BCL-6 corepressor n=1 Tax=Aquatica leii TaxID=1421715 RepID=A0AAN7PJ63_9COLE|nr:hypothetical protein RN001_006875 [Aquatica leii]